MVVIDKKHYDASSPLAHVYYNLTHRADVTVCKAWRDSKDVFIQWSIENGYVEGARISRVDKNKGFTPSNTVIIVPKYRANVKRLVKLTQAHKGKHIKVTLKNRS